MSKAARKVVSLEGMSRGKAAWEVFQRRNRLFSRRYSLRDLTTERVRHLGEDDIRRSEKRFPSATIDALPHVRASATYHLTATLASMITTGRAPLG